MLEKGIEREQEQMKDRNKGDKDKWRKWRTQLRFYEHDIHNYN